MIEFYSVGLPYRQSLLEEVDAGGFSPYPVCLAADRD